MYIFSGPKIFKSGSAVPLHRVLSNEASHDHSSMYIVSLTENSAKGGQKGPKTGQEGAKKFLLSLKTIRNALKGQKKRKKIFLKIFGPLKIAIFGQNLRCLGTKRGQKGAKNGAKRG